MKRKVLSRPEAASTLTLLKKSVAAALVGLAACALPAHAELIDFNNSSLGTLDGGQFVNAGGGFRATAIDGPVARELGFTGLAGLVIDGANPLSCDTLACPTGNTSQYYAGLNDGAVALTGASDFALNALKYAFVAPIGGLTDFVYGQLVLTGTRNDGTVISATRDFPGQDGGGNYVFGEWILDGLFAGARLSQLTISACLFDAAGACVNSFDNPAFNQAQFAIDDIDVNAIPEPSTAFLVLLGLMGVGYASRRRAAPASPSSTIR